MTDKTRNDELDLEAQEGEVLADREMMTILPISGDPPLVVPDPEVYEASPDDPPGT
jgi:hypothetical protein